MDALKELFISMQNANLSLPALEVSLLLVVLTCCLVFRFSKTGLIASYIFSYRWGWLFFTDHEQEYLLAYLVFGIVVGTLTVVQLMRAPAVSPQE